MGYTVFSAAGLAQVVRAGDSRRFKVDLKNDRNAIIAAASQNALQNAIRLDAFHVTKLRGKHCVSYPDYERALVLRSIARHLKRRLRIQMPDRNKAVRGTITTLLDSTPMSIVRCDIASFYETIFIDNIRNRLLYDTASSAIVRGYFRSYFEAHCSGKSQGLPRGAGLSAVLSEIAIRDFDERVRAMDGVYRYFRYADDIIVFCLGSPETLLRDMSLALPKGMRFNRKKTKVYDLTAGLVANGMPPRPRKEIEYLGYQFRIEDESGKTRSRRIDVTIAPKKITRLKTKMIMAFRSYLNDHDHGLLIDRIRFISSNYKVKRTGNTHVKGAKHIKSGIYYNYHLCGSYRINRKFELNRTPPDMHELKALDGMLRSLIRSSSSEFRNSVTGFMPLQQKRSLLSLSFYHGYTSKMLMRVSPDRVGQIKKAWKNA